MINNLEYYRSFYYAGKYESFSKAAEELFLTQSAVSQSIHRLEKEVGAPLFHRVAHNMILTPEGKLLYQHVALAMSTLHGGEEQLSRLVNMKEGELNIGATETGLIHCILPNLARFKKKYPQIKLNVRGTQSRELMNLLSSGSIDLAVGVTPVPDTRAVTVTLLKSFQDVFFAGEAFSFLKGQILRPEELLKYPLVMASTGSSFASNLSDWFARQGYSFNPEIQVMTTSFVRPFAEQGLAIGCAPEMFVQHWTASGKLFPIQLTNTPPTRNLFLATNRELPLSVAAQKFAAIISKMVQETTPNE